MAALGDLAVGGVVTVQLHDDEELRNKSAHAVPLASDKFRS